MASPKSKLWWILWVHVCLWFVRAQKLSQPHFGQCEDETHTPKSGNFEYSRTPATSELDNRGQKTSPWGVLYTVGKVSKCRCPKWPRMSHLDICSPSYGQKKGQKSNCQLAVWLPTTKSRESTQFRRL